MQFHHLSPTFWIAIGMLALAAVLIAMKRLALVRERRLTYQLTEESIRLERLKQVVAHMLSLANEVDETNKYLPSASRQATGPLVGKACGDLVKVSESIVLVEQLLEGRNLPAARRGLLQSCKMASKISDELSEVGLFQKPLLEQSKNAAEKSRKDADQQ